MEMFVGRSEESEKLVKQPSFSRIFSGRRLGKTALLRHVQSHSGYESLPSGNRFTVVFCPIAGMATEGEVARAVYDELAKTRDDFAMDDASDADDSGKRGVARLKRAVKELLERHPSESFMVLLDEADTFYDAQISASSAHTQQSLSWWMSRDAERYTDSHGLPRMRFVFCGYLHTDQNRGVWENKGDVLVLGPLESNEAMRLVTGPLARLGIDATSVAHNIAFRCGYQPAVIIRFGIELIDYLSTTIPVQQRAAAKVTGRDVVEVFQRNRVQEDIRHACRLNFAGHPLGQLVFYGLLLELRGRPPAAAVQDAVDVVTSRIREVVPDFDPQRDYAGDWRDLVARQLRAFVDRSLLVQAEFRPATYRLRFPHHLSVLLQDDPAAHVRDALARLRAAPVNVDSDWVLGDGVMDSIYDYLGQDAYELGYRAVVLATHWPEPLLHEDEGLAAVLRKQHGERPVRVIAGADAHAALAALGHEIASEVLIGGPGLGRATRNEAPECALCELMPTRRLSERQVLAWFQRKRATEFTARGAPERVFAATGGIPILLRELDEILCSKFPVAPTLGVNDLEALLGDLSDRLPSVAKRLTPGGGSDALMEREVELLHLFAEASRQFGDSGVEAVMAEADDDLIVERPSNRKIAPYRPDDRPHVTLLLALGLLPRPAAVASSPTPLVGRLQESDALFRILKYLE